ncbi:MAG TPA: DUF1302 domain-containing protein [Opitutaceae bacterium]
MSQFMHVFLSSPSRIRGSRTAVLTLLYATLALRPGNAFQFALGKVAGSLDTNLSINTSYRLSDPSRTFYGTAAGGLQNSVNADDGNLNYEQGIFSLAARGTSDLLFKYDRYQAFFRATYLYDHENEHGDRARTPLTSAALDHVGTDFDLLDAFVVGRFDLAGKPFDLRLGSQVLSWGESTFIQNGINVINPIEVARIRVPGAELKDALRPVPMVSMSLGISKNITLEGFLQLTWQETEIDPPGSYFSTNDFLGAGGDRVFLGFGAVADSSSFGFVPRGPDAKAGDSGQWGVAARQLLPGLNDTEIGFFFVNYHSRLPLISARTPTRPISAAEVQATAGSLALSNLAPAMVQAGFPANQVPAALSTLLGAALTNVPAANLPASLQPFYPAALSIASSARTLGFFSSAATGRYLIEYPEDIKLYGFSFNTDLASTGISLQGEISYKTDVPIQLDDVELLFAALSSINPAFGGNNQIGNFLGQLDTRVQGWKHKDAWQAQVTATRIFGPMFGANQALLLAEVGVTHVPHLPAKEVLRFDAPGTYTSGDASAMLLSGNGAFPATPYDAFASETSWGYQIVGRLEYNNAFLGMNVAPTLAVAHDVSGVTPLPLGNFRKDRITVTSAVELTYLNQYALEIRYVNYSGAGQYNLLGDRDFVSVIAKYSF